MNSEMEIKDIDILEKRIGGAVNLIDGLKKREDNLKNKLRFLEEENRLLKAQSKDLSRGREEARVRVQALLEKLKLAEE